MKDLKDAILTKLQWKRSNLLATKWTLLSGTDTIAIMKLPMLLDTKILVEFSNQTLIFTKGLLLDPHLSIDSGNGVHLADFTHSLDAISLIRGGGGELLMVDGRKFFWNPASQFRLRSYWILDNKHSVVQFIHPVFDMGNNTAINIDQTIVNVTDISILVALGWYLHVTAELQHSI